ncbi:Iron-containing alcohol dehydrogenase [Desulfatibacillum aliphaticivorans]|uniref:Iron-containing alcohol dehydrogenase n=1 Tax=Desulfatibacillum aliphaticivorans TaxID=218208 RepID=B8F9S6_DESAL|nr:phosphonoacetaldehyde reductase [Desulfatibacillum aliphaticivorans]ACL03022.1 Iron-containing alcohol dehydrogenase [Desulfatibacillum aliphaticivorans]
MAATWTYHNPVQVFCGRGARKMVSEVLNGKQVLVVCSQRGKEQFTGDPILKGIGRGTNIEWMDNVKANPGLDKLQSDIDRLTGASFDAVVGFGGGSAIDSAKALSIGLSAKKSDHTLTHVIDNPSLLQRMHSIPVVAVPTTSGTGSEVTPFATIWNHRQKKKLSLSGPAVYARTAVVDPELTDNLPQAETIYTGMDAINQAAESIWNKNATPLSIMYGTESLRKGLKALLILNDGKGGAVERDAMAESSLLAGLAISQTRTALCHSISYPLTAQFGVPHGLACAFTMAQVLKLNLEGHPYRFDVLSKALGVSSVTAVFDDFAKRMGIDFRIREYISDWEQIVPLIPEMFTPGRADNNIADVDETKIEMLLKASWKID